MARVERRTGPSGHDAGEDHADRDHDRVRQLLGREPGGRYDIVVRNPAGEPMVIRNAPLLEDGTPMPTRYWLVGRDEVTAVSRLESAGGVRAAESAVDPALLAAAHARYAAERDAELPAGAAPRPSGGVAGTRQGVKCLHAHYAWHLAGGDDPVGRWVADQLASGSASRSAAQPTDPRPEGDSDGQFGSRPRQPDSPPAPPASRLDVEISADRTIVRHGGWTSVLPVSAQSLVDGQLSEHDPPSPLSLTNALGLLTDHLDDVLREHPDVIDWRLVGLSGDEAWHLACVERGTADLPSAVTIERDDLEDLFRTLATESRAQRLHNPAMRADRVDLIVATCCTTLAVMRRLLVADAQFTPSAGFAPVGQGRP